MPNFSTSIGMNGVERNMPMAGMAALSPIMLRSMPRASRIRASRGRPSPRVKPYIATQAKIANRALFLFFTCHREQDADRNLCRDQVSNLSPVRRGQI